MPIGVAMMVASFGAVAFIRNETVAFRMLGSVANDSLEEYLFAIVPLFVLMGLLVTVSGVGKDTFDLFERLLRRVKAGLGIATVFANAVFASITGISVASASVFSRVAVPEMVRHGYTRRFSTGVVAGSSVLGMLIPPSLLMVVYAVLAEESVGRMFLSGVGPGILLSILFAITILIMARWWPASVFDAGGQARSGAADHLSGGLAQGRADRPARDAGARRPLRRLPEPHRGRARSARSARSASRCSGAR